VLEKIGGRKVLLGLLVMAVGALVDSFSKNGLSTNLLELMKFTSIGFFLGNSVEHIANNFKKKNVSVQADTSGIEERMDKIEEATATTQQGVSTLVQYVSQNNQGQ